jgi:putative peptidoglycan lipid II flippase
MDQHALKHTPMFVLRHIQQATLLLMVGTLATNSLGFVKSLLTAMYYGTSAELDAYFLSLTPLRFISGVLIGTVQAALIPVYLELSVNKDQEYAFAVFGTFFLGVLGLIMLIGGVMLAGGPLIAGYLGTGFAPDQVKFTTSLLRISTLLIVLTVGNELCLCLFTAHQQFLFAAFVPLVSAVCSLGYLVLFHADGVSVLMKGLIFGMAVQLMVILWAGRRFLPDCVFVLSPFIQDIRKIMKTMFPLLIGAAFVHINLMVDQIMASTLPAGSIAALQYANKLHSILTQMFIMVVSSAVFPFFARQVAEQDWNALKATFLMTIKRVLSVLVPITVGIAVLGKPLVQLVFQRGAFSAQATAATAGAWIAYTLGLPTMAIGILAARMYNALQENTTLMYVSGGSIGLNIVLNWVFMQFWGHIGIALSTSLVYVVNTGILCYGLHRKIGPFWRCAN